MIKVALKYRFYLPPFYTLILRSLATLEGIALAVNPNFKIVAAAFPYVLRMVSGEVGWGVGVGVIRPPCHGDG